MKTTYIHMYNIITSKYLAKKKKFNYWLIICPLNLYVNQMLLIFGTCQHEIIEMKLKILVFLLIIVLPSLLHVGWQKYKNFYRSTWWYVSNGYNKGDVPKDLEIFFVSFEMVGLLFWTNQVSWLIIILITLSQKLIILFIFLMGCSRLKWSSRKLQPE